MARAFQLVCLFFFAALLLGCATNPPTSDSDLILSIFGSKPVIGQSRRDLIDKLGNPYEVLTLNDRKFMMYLTTTETTAAFDWQPIFQSPIVLPVGKRERSLLHCLTFELDSNNNVSSYRSSSSKVSYDVNPGGWGMKRSCRYMLFSKSDQKQLSGKAMMEGKSKSELRQLAIGGNSYAQLQLYLIYISEERDKAHWWLCKSADQGNSEAQLNLGNTFEWSVRDSVQAYVWYSLSDYLSKEGLRSYAEQYLNVEELREAEKALRDWQPGQCEKQLGLSQDNQ